MTVTAYVIRTYIRRTAVQDLSALVLPLPLTNHIICTHCYGDQIKVAVVRVREMRNPYSYLVGKPEVKRQLGRLKEDNIQREMKEGVDFIKVATDGF